MAVARHSAHPTNVGTTTAHVGTGDSPVQPSASSAAVFVLSGWGNDQIRQTQRRKSLDDLHGFQTDGNDLANQANNVLRIIVPVGIIRDAAALVSGDLILVDYPFKSRPVPEPVFVSLRWNTTKSQKLVVNDRSLVLAQAHFGNAPVELLSRLLCFG